MDANRYRRPTEVRSARAQEGQDSCRDSGTGSTALSGAGYDETSVEQIAEAAEVSPSTVFRYFPSKPDLVIYDDLDDRMIEAFARSPRSDRCPGLARCVPFQLW